MKKLLLYVFLAALSSLHQSCKEDKGGDLQFENIRIPFAQVETLDINEGEIISLEVDGEKTLIPYVSNLFEVQNSLFLASSKSVFKYDKTGHFQSIIGAFGHANSEYVDTRSVFDVDDKIFVFNWSSRKIVAYDTLGTFVSKVDIHSNKHNIYPSSLFKTNDGTYLSLNCFQGESVETPAFSLFSSSGNYIGDVEGLLKKDGTNHTELRYSDKTNTLLYSDAFNDTIYRVNPVEGRVERAYYIDYGEHKFTELEKKGKNFVQMCQYSNQEHCMMTKAGPVYSCYETDENMMFVFLFQRKVHFVCYNKDKQETHLYRLEDKTSKLEPSLFAAYSDGCVYFSCVNQQNIESNPVLVKISFNKFKDAYGRCEDPSAAHDL